MSKAIIAKITNTIEIPGADKIQCAVVLGENVVVSKDLQVGYVGVFFPTETQLSEDYCKNNNLYRHSHLNKDPTKAGFFEDNRRVKALSLLKVRSSGYFASLESLEYASIVGKVYDIGQTFDELNGKQICCKYLSAATKDAIAKQNRPKMAKATLAPFFEKHVDSSQFKHNAQMIPKGALIYFAAKIHGTSSRMAHTLVNVDLPKWKQFVNKFAPIFPTQKWDYVVGTRNVVLKSNEATGFHGSEQYRFDVLESLKPFMTKGLSIYGEISGYANGKPIMAVHNSKDTKDKAFIKKYGENIVYKYGCAEHEYRFHVYRITMLNHEGQNVDFSEAQLQQWCLDHGILAPLNVCEPIIYDGDVEALMKKVELLTERPDVLGEDYVDSSMPGEGIIMRIETGKMNPYFLKNKLFNFKVMESICEAIDVEDLEAA